MVAEAIPIHLRTYQEIESGERKDINLSLLEQIAAALKIVPADLLTSIDTQMQSPVIENALFRQKIETFLNQHSDLIQKQHKLTEQISTILKYVKE